MVLTKSEILGGINHIQKINIESLGGELYLRPLSESELMEVDLVEAKALGTFESTQTGRKSASNKGKINLAKATQASSQAKLTKIQLSINNEKNAEEWTLEEIGQLSRETINELSSKVDEISGVETTKEDVEKFPEE